MAGLYVKLRRKRCGADVGSEGDGTMKRKRSKKVDRIIDTRNQGCVELNWTPDARAYMVTSVVVAFLLTVFAVLLPAAA